MRAVRSEPPWAALRAPSFLVEERQKSSKRNNNEVVQNANMLQPLDSSVPMPEMG
jgi:hypothetical protein